MKKPLRASALLLLAAAFARPAAAQTTLPPVVVPERGADDTTRVRLQGLPDSTQVQLQLQPDSLVAEPVKIDPKRLAWLQTAPEMRDLVCDRLGCIESDMPLTFNATVMAHVTYFTERNRKYMQRVLEREKLYFPLFEKYLAKYNLPQDLKYLAVVESALIPTAKSRVGATGLWQFMGPTAGDLRLRRDEWVDERMDPEKATEAACKHLRYLYGMLHDWELVLAAYNWGGGNVQRVMKRTGKRNYWDLYPHMPKETRNYVPSFTAIMYAMKYADQHRLHAPDLQYQYAQEMDTLNVGGRLFDVSRLSIAVGLDSAAMLRFNPELRKHYLPEGYRPYAVKFPAIYRPQLREVDRATLFEFCRPAAALPQYIQALPPRLEGVEPFPSATLLASAKNPPVRDTARQRNTARTQRKVHSVKRGQTLGELASWYGVSQADLRRWNNLPKGRALKAKQQLVVFVPVKDQETTSHMAVAVRATAPPAVAAVPRTPTEMGVKVTKLPVAPLPKPTPAEQTTAAATAIVSPAAEPSAPAPAVEARTVAVAARGASKGTPPALALANAKPVVLPVDEPAAEPVSQPAVTEYVVRKGDYMSKLAREHGVSIAQLMEWNQLKSTAVTPGQKLRLTAPEETTETSEGAETVASAELAKPAAPAAVASSNKKLQPRELIPMPRRVHIVQPGDTLYNISRRYQGLSVEQLRKLNGLKSDDVKPGQKLIVAS